MSITEKLNGQGQFSVTLKEEAPESLVRVIDFAGHLLVTTERMEVTALSDADFRDQARYMGVVIYKPMDQNGLTIKGKGLVWWLGDGANRGKVFRGGTILDFVNKGFDAGWTDILAALTPITKGTIESTAGTYTHKFDLVTQRQAADRFADAFGAEYRINRDFTLDSGASGFLYNATPTAVIARRFSGDDPETDGLVATQIQSIEDIESFVTTAILAAEGTGDSLQTSEQSLGDKLFKDPQGNDIDRSQVFNQPDTTTGDASDRAQLLLDQFGVVQKTVKLNLEDFHVKGEFVVGDLIYVWDPKTSLFDNTKELTFRGQVLNPIAIRVVGISWPIIRGMGVYFRDEDGVYTDLTDYVAWQSGSVIIEVGASSRNLVEGTSEALDARITIDPDGNDSLTPSQPTHKSTPWSTFQDVNSQGVATSRVVVEWNTPTNTDSSVVTDGLGFNIRYRKQGETEYSTQFAAWGLEASVVEGLAPGVVYELNVEAGDANGNYSGYGAVSDEVVTAATDGVAPSQPSAPTVAGNVLNIQITHDVQKQAGGDLESDMSHLNVYADTSSGFTPSASNLLGEINVTQAMMSLGLAVIASFGMESTTQRFVVVTAVDRDGNESPKSSESTVTALLIDTQHITDALITTAKIGDLQVTNAKIDTLNVNKLVAGTIGVHVIKLSNSASSRIESNDGTSMIIRGNGTAVFTNITATGQINATTGTLTTLTIDGTLTMGASGLLRTSSGANRIEMRFDDPGEIRFYQSGAASANFGIIDSGNGLLAINSPYAAAGNPTQILLSSVSNAMFLSIAGAERARLTTDGFRVANGSVTTPSVSFLSDTDTGSFRSSANVYAIAAGGVLSARFVAAGIRAQNGTAAAPSIAGASHTTTGLYWTSSTLLIAGGGAEAAKFLSNNVFLTGARSNTTGSAANTLIQAVDGRIFRSTSLRAHKSRITYNVDHLADIELRPEKHYRKDDKRWYYGFVAEDLYDQDEIMGEYDRGESELQNYDLRAVVAVLAAKVNRLEAAA